MLALQLGQPIIDGREVTESSKVCADRIVDRGRKTASPDEFPKLLQMLAVERERDFLAGHKRMIVLLYAQVQNRIQLMAGSRASAHVFRIRSFLWSWR